MGFERFFGNLTDWSKFPPRVLFALTALCAAFLFVDKLFFERIGLVDIQDIGRPYFGVGFLLFGFLFISFPVTEGLKLLYKLLKQKYEQWRLRKHFLEWFTHLTLAQKNILRAFIENNTRSMSLDYKDGAVNELMNAQILYLPTNVSVFESRPRYGDGMYTDYNMQPWIFKYLKEHPEILSPSSKLEKSNFDKS